MTSEEEDLTLLFEWEEVLLKDFLKHAREWLWNNKHWVDEDLI